MAYGNAPGSDTSDQIRLYVGDISTSTSNELLTDADYDHFSGVSSSVWIAAALAANSLAAKFMAVSSDTSEVTVGDLTIKRSDAASAAKGYRELSRLFGRRAAAGIAPYAGGQSISGKRTEEADTDRVEPMFARGLFSNPAVLGFTGQLST